MTLAHPNPTVKLSGRLKLVLGSIVHPQDRLSAMDLERLLWEHDDHSGVKSTLTDLRSVVLIPDDDTNAIRITSLSESHIHAGYEAPAHNTFPGLSSGHVQPLG